MGKAGENQISRRERFPSSMPMLVPMVMVAMVMRVVMVVVVMAVMAVVLVRMIMTRMGMRAMVIGSALGVEGRFYLDHLGAQPLQHVGDHMVAPDADMAG